MEVKRKNSGNNNDYHKTIYVFLLVTMSKLISLQDSAENFIIRLVFNKILAKILLVH